MIGTRTILLQVAALGLAWTLPAQGPGEDPGPGRGEERCAKALREALAAQVAELEAILGAAGRGAREGRRVAAVLKALEKAARTASALTPAAAPSRQETDGLRSFQVRPGPTGLGGILLQPFQRMDRAGRARACRALAREIEEAMPILRRGPDDRWADEVTAAYSRMAELLAAGEAKAADRIRVRTVYKVFPALRKQEKSPKPGAKTSNRILKRLVAQLAGSERLRKMLAERILDLKNRYVRAAEKGEMEAAAELGRRIRRATALVRRLAEVRKPEAGPPITGLEEFRLKPGRSGLGGCLTQPFQRMGPRRLAQVRRFMELDMEGALPRLRRQGDDPWADRIAAAYALMEKLLAAGKVEEADLVRVRTVHRIFPRTAPAAQSVEPERRAGREPGPARERMVELLEALIEQLKEAPPRRGEEQERAGEGRQGRLPGRGKGVLPD
jgi:hypothetical protein